MIKLATCFSGIGAIEWAFKRMSLEHEIVFACDNNDIDISAYIDYAKELEIIKTLDVNERAEYIRQIYKKHSRKTNFVEKSYIANYDITSDKFYYDIKLLDATPFKNNVDILVGGSPCQSFSIIGKLRGFEDTRGTLFFEFARLINECEPKVFIYENVKNLIYHDKGKTFKIMQEVFTSLGYHIKYAILNAKDFGIPQNRQRVFVIGFKDEKYFNRFLIPTPTLLNFFSNENILTMQDLLIDNCDFNCFLSDKAGDLIIKKQKGDVFNYDKSAYMSDKLIDFVLSQPTGKFSERKKDNTINTPIAKTITKSHGNYLRAFMANYVTTNNRLRALSCREVLRLMGFTDEFKIVVSRSQIMPQAGNSIVVDVLIGILRNILNTQIFKKNNEK